MNPFYERQFDVNPQTFARSLQVEGEFTRIEQGFDGVKTRLDSADAVGTALNAEVVAAREGQASLLLSIQRKANLASPTFTGTPSAPTAVRTSNDNTLATTQFVWSVVSSVNAQTGALIDVIVTAATYTASIGQRVILAGSMQQTITAPAYADDARWGFKVCNGRTDNVINWAGANHQGISDATMVLDSQHAVSEVIGVNSTYGWGLV